MSCALLAFTLSPFALAQTAGTIDSSGSSPAARSDALDRVLDLVGPVPAAFPARRERFAEFVLNTVGPVPLVGEAAGAAVEQLMNTPKDWRQGWDAFAKRYWSNLAYNGIRQTISYGGSLALDEDARYFASRRPGFWPRVRHALVSTFTARHADGRDSFSYSGVAGVIGASAISSAWGPHAWRGPGNIAKNAGISFASTAATDIAQEFLPDLLGRPRK
jgi:hypothetical protein